MQYDPANPLIVQGDRTVLVEVDNPFYAEARDALAPFAELEKSPEHIHTYRLTPLSLWNAAAAGHDRRGDGRGAAPATASSRSRPTCRPTSPSWSAATAGSSSSGSTDELRLVCPGHSRCSRSWPASKKVRDYLGERLDATSFAVDAGPPRRPQAGADRRRLPGRGPGRLHRGGRRCRCTLREVGRVGAAVPGPRLPARGGRRLLRRRRRPRRLRRHRPALRRRQDHRRHRRHGRCCSKNTLVLTTSITAVKQWRREILDKTDLDRRPGRRVHRRDRRTIAPGDAGDVPDPDLPPRQDGGVPALQALRRARLGPDHLRRGPPAARPGVPRHGPDPGPPPARPDRHAGPRGRPRGRRLQPDRPEEVRRALARAGDARAGSPRPTATRSAWPCPTPLRMEYAVAEWREKYRIASENPAKDDVVGRAARPATRDEPGAGHRPVPQAAPADRRAVRHPADHRADRRTPSARTCTTSSAAARSGT